jgi:hypothetical protein
MGLCRKQLLASLNGLEAGKNPACAQRGGSCGTPPAGLSAGCSEPTLINKKHHDRHYFD